MLTYMQIKHAIDDSYWLNDLILDLLPLLLLIPLDLITIFLQPIYFIAYKKWNKNRWHTNR